MIGRKIFPKFIVAEAIRRSTGNPHIDVRELELYVKELGIAPLEVLRWATYNGCSITPDTSSPNLDLDVRLAGDETVVARYTAGCSAGGSAELWTIVGGGHIPSLSRNFAREVVDYLLAHPKPGPPTVSMQAPVSPEPLSRGETP